MRRPEQPGGPDEAPPLADPETAAVVRLLRRRRRWTVAACCTVPVFAILLIATVIASVQALRSGDSFPPAWQLAAFLGVPGAIAVTALAGSVGGSVRLRNVPGETQARARAVMSWRPARVRARAERRFGWFARTAFWVFVLGYQALLVALLPGVVDGAAYLAGAGPSATFVPQSYQRVCIKSGCHTETLGRLEGVSGSAGTDWPAQVPLGRPFTVREPVWTWGPGSGQLVNGTLAAVERVGVGVLLLFFEGVVVLLIGLVTGRPRGRGRHAGPAS